MSVRRLQTSVMEASAPTSPVNIAVCVSMDSWPPWTWGPASVRQPRKLLLKPAIPSLSFLWHIPWFILTSIPTQMCCFCFSFWHLWDCCCQTQFQSLWSLLRQRSYGIRLFLSVQMWMNAIWTQTSVSMATVRTPKAPSSATVSWDTLSKKDQRAAQVEKWTVDHWGGSSMHAVTSGPCC